MAVARPELGIDELAWLLDVARAASDGSRLPKVTIRELERAQVRAHEALEREQAKHRRIQRRHPQNLANLAEGESDPTLDAEFARIQREVRIVD